MISLDELTEPPQCQAAYFDGESIVCCVVDDGHDGKHADANGDWDVRTPLPQRRKERLARAEARVELLERTLRDIRQQEESRPIEYQSMYALFAIDEVLGASTQSKSEQVKP